MTLNRFHEIFVKVFASGVGAGYVPRISGTIGSLVGLLVYYPLRDTKMLVVAAAVASLFLGTLLAGEAEKVWRTKDCPKIVVDEIAGQLVTLLFVPYSFTLMVVGFILFRIMDILKPFPARWAQDNLPGGFGVMGDDAVAGVQAGFLLWSLHMVM